MQGFEFFKHFLIFITAISGCVLISPFASLIGVSVGITSSSLGLKIGWITGGIETYK